MFYRFLKLTPFLAAVLALLAGLSGPAGVARADHCQPGETHVQTSPSAPAGCVPTAGGGDGGGQPSPDSDGDGRTDDQDNCPNAANPDQADADEDGKGDRCDENAERNGSNADVVAFRIEGTNTQQLWFRCVDRYIKVVEIAQAILQILGNALAPLNVQLTQLLGFVAGDDPDVQVAIQAVYSLTHEGDGLFTGTVNVPGCPPPRAFHFRRSDVVGTQPCDVLLRLAEARLAEYQRRYDQAQSVVDAAGEKLRDDRAVWTEALSATNEAAKRLSDAQAEHDRRQAALEAAQTEYDRSQAALHAAQAELVRAVNANVEAMIAEAMALETAGSLPNERVAQLEGAAKAAKEQEGAAIEAGLAARDARELAGWGRVFAQRAADAAQTALQTAQAEYDASKTEFDLAEAFYADSLGAVIKAEHDAYSINVELANAQAVLDALRKACEGQDQ